MRSWKFSFSTIRTTSRAIILRGPMAVLITVGAPVWRSPSTMMAQRFAKLTGSHLPEKATGFAYQLGIIVDGRLYSAPSIRSTISERGEITGTFTAEEVSDLADLLNAGRLPAQLRLIEPKPHPKP